MAISLDDWLADVSVLEPYDRVAAVESGNTAWPDGWWAVTDNHGCIAYFRNAVDAFRFRLDYINRKLNP